MNSGFPVQTHKFLSHHGSPDIPKPRASGPPDPPVVLQSRMVSLDGSDAEGLPRAFSDMRNMGCGRLSLLLPLHTLWAVMAVHLHMSSFKVPQRV